MPLRKKPFDKRHHLTVLRCGIIGVAIFAYLFSLVFSLKESIYMYFAITGAIYMGGAGSVIIGGLYWKRGTTAAAWASLTTGTVLGLGGILVQQIWAPWLAPLLLKLFPGSAYLAAHTEKFPLNGQYVYFLTMLSSILIYIIVSLLGRGRIFNLDKLLHRGDYADEMSAAALKKQPFSLSALIGINSNFTFFDKVIAWASTGWSMGWWLIFIVVTTLGLCTSLISDELWETIWWWKLVPFTLVLGTGCTFWIAIGGLRDACSLIRDLAHHKTDDSDNGFIE
jgi:SSS family solute:Na+ symporter